MSDTTIVIVVKDAKMEEVIKELVMMFFKEYVSSIYVTEEVELSHRHDGASMIQTLERQGRV